MTAGIYIIENTMTGACYVGSSYNVKKRWKEHRGHLRRNTHHSRFMQNVWNKYGEQVLQFRVAVICAVKDLMFYEQRIIDGLNPKYNSAKVAGSCLGVKHDRAVVERLKNVWRTKRNAKYEWNGEKVALITVAEKTGVPYKTLIARVVGNGWSVDRAISEPVRDVQRKHQHDGRSMTLPQWAAELQMHPRRLSYWLNAGLSIGDCVVRLNREAKAMSVMEFCKVWGISPQTVKSRLGNGESMGTALREPRKMNNSWRRAA